MPSQPDRFCSPHSQYSELIAICCRSRSSSTCRRTMRLPNLRTRWAGSLRSMACWARWRSWWCSQGKKMLTTRRRAHGFLTVYYTLVNHRHHGGHDGAAGGLDYLYLHQINKREVLAMVVTVVPGIKKCMCVAGVCLTAGSQNAKFSPFMMSCIARLYNPPLDRGRMTESIVVWSKIRQATCQ